MKMLLKLFLAVALVALVARQSSSVPPGGSGNAAFRSNLTPPVAASTGDPCSSCTNETFEGTGTSVAGWKFGDNTAGTITNVDYTTAPAPINGSQSLLIRNVDTQQGLLQLTVPSSPEIYHRCAVIFTNKVVDTMRYFRADDNVGGIMLQVQVQSAKLRIVCGTATADTVSTLNADTVYYIWWHYLKGSGANAVADVAFSTSKIKPVSGNNFAQVTTGTSANNVTDVFINVGHPSFGSGVAGVIFDDWSFSPNSIGDFP